MGVRRLPEEERQARAAQVDRHAKTAAYKELSPANPDWMYIRAASIARKVYVRGGLGVGGLKKIYGVRPTHFATSSGAIARHLMKELERLKVVEKDKNGGRKITSTGARSGPHCRPGG